ncbi:LPS assembly lipoprotein LptE [Celerinatantimonas sp. YJH-8]|uniref:LPS-assembly lipoprotein LptE n=1 Tax=Celerinatantimonas sp. YJH-8 TaxID=3228714 RepID=UPI0038BF50E3
MDKLIQCPLRALFKRYRQALVLVVAVSLLSACGFHLRGNYLINSKLSALYLVSSDPYSDLTLDLENQLRQNNIKLLDAPSDQAPVVELKSPSITSRIVSVYSDGSDAEYELSYQVEGTVTTKANIKFPLEVQLHRDFTSDNHQALAKLRERDLIEKEMHQMAADQIVRQLATIDY